MPTKMPTDQRAPSCSAAVGAARQHVWRWRPRQQRQRHMRRRERQRQRWGQRRRRRPKTRCAQRRIQWGDPGAPAGCPRATTRSVAGRRARAPMGRGCAHALAHSFRGQGTLGALTDQRASILGIVRCAVEGVRGRWWGRGETLRQGGGVRARARAKKKKKKKAGRAPSPLRSTCTKTGAQSLESGRRQT